MNDRARGSFLGLAVGDCVGAAVEGMPPWEIRKRFVRVTEMLDPFDVWESRPERGRLKGLHTDDTQQAWIVASVLLEDRRIVPEKVAQRYVSFGRPRPDLPRGIHRGTGKRFRNVVERLTAGVAPRDAGEATAGNGAAMRITPVGLVFADRPAELVREALEVSVITHLDPRGLESAVSLAYLVGALIGEGPPTDYRSCLDVAIEGARRAEESLASGVPFRPPEPLVAFSGGFRQVLEALRAFPSAEPAEQLAKIADKASELKPDKRIKRGTEGFAPASVAAAIALASAARDFREAVENLVNAGEDTDSTGAMGGAIAGARFGTAAIPDEWLKDVVARGELDVVARALAGEKEALPDQEALEESWTRAERQEAARRSGGGC